MTDYTISAVDEALALLLIVAQKPGLGVTELAKVSGNTKARAFRILFTLEQRNFVVRKIQDLVISLIFKRCTSV